ncbi:MAG: corrinoid protein [Desulfarculaceae bacterium]|jgi:5-methyltetrahydrofolate--homocysteine methyltransferase
MEDVLQQINQALITGNAPLTVELVQKALDQKLDPGVILDQGLVAAMAVIGRKFKADEIYMPEVMIAARAMNSSMEVLEPILAVSNHQPRGKFLIATVKGDLHDVGKNMVSMMLRGGGYQIVDLGIDVAPDKIVAAIEQEKPDIVGLSALLTSTLPSMKDTIDAIGKAGHRSWMRIMVGGAPVTEEFAARIGADGWAPDAASAVEKAGELLAARD